MSVNDKTYEIIITQEGLDTYSGSNISASTMGEYLGINSVMTDFEWDEDINKGVILYAKVVDDIATQDALAELEGVEFIEKVEESEF
ncbi:hypothetical protein [Clostridium estertheticum]|uniref:hypothetical protein n=1 Tax=Clostridium estertheticum TaxID=238834 RepID=UPI001C0CFF25|nr:hypothetical protein [Clostridium estertheticum]MBU3185480.1 hypothetical protein [Clostridium estertheticum]